MSSPKERLNYLKEFVQPYLDEIAEIEKSIANKNSKQTQIISLYPFYNGKVPIQSIGKINGSLILACQRNKNDQTEYQRPCVSNGNFVYNFDNYRSDHKSWISILNYGYTWNYGYFPVIKINERD